MRGNELALYNTIMGVGMKIWVLTSFLMGISSAIMSGDLKNHFEQLYYQQIRETRRRLALKRKRRTWTTT